MAFVCGLVARSVAPLAVLCFFNTDENEYYFPFILFVSYVICIIYVCPGVGYPSWFLGVAIGLELRIRL